MIEWDTSNLSAERRAYLDSNFSFEAIASRVISKSEIAKVEIRPYGDAPPHEKDGRQVVFLIHLVREESDLLYNSADGLRGRYWQSPDNGSVATKQLIAGLRPRLISYAEQHPPTQPQKVAPMASDDLMASLDAGSAKVWPKERNDAKTEFLLVEVEDQLLVRRWVEKQKEDRRKPGWWRRDFRDGKTCEWEIKGGLLGTNRTEYIPEDKRDRSRQIFQFGFT
jgi:hypothetical protein